MGGKWAETGYMGFSGHGRDSGFHSMAMGGPRRVSKRKLLACLAFKGLTLPVEGQGQGRKQRLVVWPKGRLGEGWRAMNRSETRAFKAEAITLGAEGYDPAGVSSLIWRTQNPGLGRKADIACTEGGS